MGCPRGQIRLAWFWLGRYEPSQSEFGKQKRWLFPSLWDSLHMAGCSEVKPHSKIRKPRGRRPPGSALSQRSGRQCVEISHGEVEAA